MLTSEDGILTRKQEDVNGLFTGDVEEIKIISKQRRNARKLVENVSYC